MAVLVFVDRSGIGVLSMPAFWYRSRPMHLMICVGFLGGGGLLLRKPSRAVQAKPGIQPAERLKQANVGTPLLETLRLFTRSDCPLCEQAMDLLEEYGHLLPEIEYIDIDGNEELERVHGESIPVLEIEGKIRFRGRIQRWQLERQLDARLRQRKRRTGEKIR